MDDGYSAACALTCLCDDLMRIARGEQPRGEFGKTDDELVKRAEGLSRILLKEGRKTLIPAIETGDSSRPQQVLAVSFGGASGANVHRAVINLALLIDRALRDAEDVCGLSKSDFGFKDWWPRARKVLAALPPIDMEWIRESLLGESRLTNPVVPTGSTPPSLIPGNQRGEPVPTVPMRPLGRAMALLIEHPDWTDTQIAEAAGISRTTLYKPTFKPYQDARALAKGDMPTGTKFNGDLEAFDPESEE